VLHVISHRFDLSNKVALVVGGRGLLGSRFTTALSECGAKVYAADLPEPSRAAKQDPARTDGSGVSQRTVDVSDPASVRSLVEGVVAEASRIDILIYSVTTKPDDVYKPFTECSLEGWQQLMRAELDGLFLVTQHVGRAMEAAGGGSIILMGSIYGVVGNDQRVYEGSNLPQLYAGGGAGQATRVHSHAGYAAAKGAVIALTRFLGAYWGKMGIRVNCISPGGAAHPGEDEEFVRRYAERVPLGRKAGLDEISGAIIYLASDASSYVTGHNLVVDGGWTAW
jgi:NAD(P)-dependent dehydrogenase (short-subunit alcohol dehydrogenase family)